MRVKFKIKEPKVVSRGLTPVIVRSVVQKQPAAPESPSDGKWYCTDGYDWSALKSGEFN